MKALAVVLVLSLASCGVSITPGYQRRIPKECAAEVADYVERIATAANPHSDEEPEDMLLEIWREAEALWSVPMPGAFVSLDGGPAVFVPYDEAPPLIRERIEKELLGQ